MCATRHSPASIEPPQALFAAPHVQRALIRLLAQSAAACRGVTEVVNRFGGNCFGCHAAAKPQWDLICEQDHGCKPLPIPTATIVAFQKADPRCKAQAGAATAAVLRR